MKIVGLGYKSRSGKDTSAEILRGKFALRGLHVQVIPFARKLKQVAHDLYGMYGLQDEFFYNQKHNEHLRDVPLPVINKTPVEIWIALGDTLKKATYEPLWRDYVFRRAQCEVLIVPDMRYPAEMDAILDLDGVVARVDRATSVTKASDAYLDGCQLWHFIIDNNGTIESLGKQLDSVVTAVLTENVE